jgi:hypothetical protein
LLAVFRGAPGLDGEVAKRGAPGDGGEEFGRRAGAGIEVESRELADRGMGGAKKGF